MLLFYRGGTEAVTLDIDRKKKILFVSSSKTGYKKVQTEWYNLFDKGKEKLQEKVTDKLDDDTFIQVINYNMSKNGYTRVI